MENPAGIESLFFELASESRLGILRELNMKNWKMNDLARKLDLTTTETFRQLQRLNEALLVQKQVGGAYAITLYGTLVLQLSPSLEFIFKHKEYFSTHDIRCLPYQFRNRIGELSGANLNMNAVENLNKVGQIVGEAEQYMWGLREGLGIESMFPIFEEQMRKGIKFRELFPESDLTTYRIGPEMGRSIEGRVLPLSDVHATFAVTEKEAVVFFPLVGGRTDFTGFVGKDPIFLNWVKDLFLYYWEKGKRT